MTESSTIATRTATYDLSGFTPEEIVEHLEAGLARDMPHLSCSVELRDGNIHVKAVQA